MRRCFIRLIFGCILAGLAGGCSKEQPDKFPTPTAIPTKTAETTPGAVTMPTLMPMPVGIEIPIGEDYFGDVRFCAYLKENFDADGNGFFSNEELTAITEIKLSSSRYMINPYTELKGFSFFTELEHLELNSADSVVLRDVPKLRHLLFTSQYAIKVGEVLIENCPELHSVYMSEVLLKDAEGIKESVFYVKNCPKFGELSVYDSDFSEGMVDITEASPGLDVRFHDVVLPDRFCLDASTYVSIEPEMVCKVKEHKVTVPKELEFSFGDGESRFPEKQGIAELEKAIREATESFYVRLEATDASGQDALGCTNYYVAIDSTDVEPECYEFNVNQEIRGEYDIYLNQVLVSCKEQEKEASFYIQWDEIPELPVAYSAAYGMRGSCYLRGELYHVTEEKEVKLGNVIFHGAYKIDEIGRLEFRHEAIPRFE